MRKLNFWLMASLLSGAILITSCSDKDDDPTPTPQPKDKIEEGTAVNPANMTMSALSGFVYDVNGKALTNVKVTSGSENCLTGPDGGFVLDKVKNVNGRSVVKFTLDGYVDVVRSMPVIAGDVWEVTMSSIYSYNGGKNVASDGFYVTDGVTLTIPETKMTVELESNGLKYDDTGEPITSNHSYIGIDMLYLSPDSDYFATLMPGGDLAAVRDNEGNEEEVQLISWGMVNVNLQLNGRKVQLADGQPAKLTFPIPEKFKDMDPLPAEIPLWSFDEERGLWVESGTATYNDIEKVYEGTVAHFSWVNLDYPEYRATLIVNVKDENGNVIPNQAVNIDGQRTFFTDVNGVIQCYVPINTDFYVTVNSHDYSNYAPVVKKEVPKMTVAGETTTVDIELPVMKHISGKVVNSGRGNNLSSLWIEYGENGDKITKTVHTDVAGQFILNAPFDYTGPAKLVLLASDGSKRNFDINLDGQDHAYTLSIATDKGTGGTVNFTPTEGETQTIVVNPIFTSDFNGVEVVDNRLSVSADNISLTIENYSESQSTYNNVEVSLYSNYYDVSRVANVTVTKSEYNTYKFQLSGKAESYQWDGKAYSYKNVGYVEGEFVAPLLGKGRNIKDVVNKETFFPSFTPWIDGDTANVGLQITESPCLGKGVMLWFNSPNLGYNDYKAFKALATTALGDPIMDDDNYEEYEDGGWGMATSYFYKNGKYIMVFFSSWAGHEDDFDIDLFSLADFDERAYIKVHVLEGMTISPEVLMEGRHHHHFK